jgi:hypothetical protein
MADKQKYPVFSEKNWWVLRKQFQSSVPKEISTTYLKSLFDLTSNEAANSNLLNLKYLGIVNEENKPTPLANEWRIDESYKSACGKMLNSIYPNELMDLFPSDGIDRKKLKNWFMTKCEVGDNAAGQMAAMFTILSNGDIKDLLSKSGSDRKTNNAKKEKEPQAIKKTPNQEKNTTVDEQSFTNEANSDRKYIHNRPNLHIDLQIHISPESTPEQIDTIFASMAKHLYGAEYK